jgi:hypothetical protein
MNFGEIYSNNKPLVIGVSVIIVLLIIMILYNYYSSSMMPGYNIGSYFPVAETQTQQKIQTTKSCMTPAMQQKIADDISKKLDEINTCDCSDACAVGNKNPTTGTTTTVTTPDTTTTSDTTSLATNQKPMKVGNNIVEPFGLSDDLAFGSWNS